MLAQHPEGLGPAALTQALGLKKSGWRQRLSGLLSRGLVRSEGFGRARRYFPVSSEPASAPQVETPPEPAAPASEDTSASPPASSAASPSVSRADAAPDAGGPSIPTAGALLIHLRGEGWLPLSTSEIARRLGLSKWRSSVAARLFALQERGHLRQDRVGAWHLAEVDRGGLP